MIAIGDISSMVAVDEVGIHAARIGPFLLKTTYQPVYRRGERSLHLAAVAGGSRFMLGGRAVAGAAIEQLPAEERDRAARLARALAVLNRVNVGVDGVAVIIPAGEGDGFDPGELETLLEDRDMLARYSDFEPARLICELPSPDSASLEELARQAAAWRRRDVGIALAAFSGSPAAIEAVRALRPEIVAVDTGWFRRIAAKAQAAQLLPSLFRSLRAVGAKVLVDRLDDAPLLAAALSAGADLLSGTVLARPVLAGTVLGEKPLPLETLPKPGDNIVPLFAS
jgi:hypothetical protein